MLMSLNTLNNHSSWGIFALRLMTGLIFLVAGFSKVTGIDGFTGMLSGLGIPAAAIIAWIIAIIELIGGIALILGAFSQLAAIPLAIIMLVSSSLRLFGAIGEAGFGGARLDLLLLAALLVFVFGAKSALSVKE